MRSDRRPRVRVVTAAPRGSRSGNRVTALRWAGLLRQLGVAVRLDSGAEHADADLLIALHARHSAPAIRRHRARSPRVPIVVVLTGTDLYRDLPGSADVHETLEQADRLIVLQPRALEALPMPLRARARVVFQSASPVPPVSRGDDDDRLRVVVSAHLREVKDPFLPVRALERIPPDVPLQIVHLGGAIEPEMGARAHAIAAREPRWRWRGDLPRGQALAELAAADLVLVTSRLEGGSNVVAEAIVAGVPVLSTRMEGSIGMLGEEYPGYVPIGDADVLAERLTEMARDRSTLGPLAAWCARRRPLFAPAREREALAELLRDLGAL